MKPFLVAIFVSFDRRRPLAANSVPTKKRMARGFIVALDIVEPVACSAPAAKDSLLDALAVLALTNSRES